jgi:hypothetical protein
VRHYDRAVGQGEEGRRHFPKAGAPATSSSEMPWIALAALGMGMPGSTRQARDASST